MTSNAIRGIRRKKSTLCEIKVAVIGAPGVGKSGSLHLFFIKNHHFLTPHNNFRE